jgi:hypothetical protein
MTPEGLPSCWLSVTHPPTTILSARNHGVDVTM